MSLVKHLKIRTPLVWVNTPEPNRYVDLAVRTCPADIYTMDPQHGFSIWERDEKRWKPILFSKVNPMTGEMVEAASHDLGSGIEYVLENPGTMIIHFAHKEADKLCHVLLWAFSDYRTAFLEDDVEKIGPQFLLFSCGADIPQDLMHLLTIENPSLPTQAELAEIATHIEVGLEEGLEGKTDLEKVSACGVGLTEQEFIKACLLSVRNSKQMDPLFVNEYKMERIKAGGNLEIRRPDMGLDQIGGLDGAKKLIRHIKWCWDNPEKAKKLGVTPTRRILLVGIQGSGKSAICEAAAKEMDLDLCKTGVSQNLNKFIGQSEENMRATFAQVKALAPIVCWIDEFGRDVSIGNWQGDGGTTSRVHAEFLTGLQELPENVFLMAAANHIGHIAPEMLRADRFDRIMFVGFPTMGERLEIFRIHLGNDGKGFNIEDLAQTASMFTGAEIKAVIADTRFRVSMDEQRGITTEDLLKAIPEMKNRMWLRHRQECLQMYDKALEDWDWASSSQKAEADKVLNGTIERAAVRGRSVHTKF